MQADPTLTDEYGKPNQRSQRKKGGIQRLNSQCGKRVVARYLRNSDYRRLHILIGTSQQRRLGEVRAFRREEESRRDKRQNFTKPLHRADKMPSILAFTSNEPTLKATTTMDSAAISKSTIRRTLWNC